MLARLKLETNAHHALADEDRLALLEVADLEQYRAFLVRILGFEAVVEQALLRIPALDRELIVERLKTGALRADLQALGSSDDDIARLPRCTNVNIRSAPQAMGWLFVIERHTLLAGVIARQLARRLGAQLHGATAYLSSCGAERGRRFRELGDALGVCARRYSATAIVGAANECFRTQRQWYVDSHRIVPIVGTSHRS